MTNLFIGLSNNQISSYKSIIEKNKKKNDVNILISSSTLSIESKFWDKIIDTSNSFNNQSSSFYTSLKNIYFKIITYKKIISQLQQYKDEKEITLYFTYIEDILTNYLLLSFNKNLKGIAVEDGTLNYYHHTIKSLSKKKFFLKWFLSNFLGVRFKFYKGHSSGIEYEHVLKQYIRVPELSLFPNKSIQLPFEYTNISFNNTALIIGQEPYINVYGRELYDERLIKLIEILKSKPYFNTLTKVYYKPHRNGERIDYNKLKENFHNINLEILDEEESLEELYFEKLESKFIYAFDSSALLNIYLEIDNHSKQNISFDVLLKYNTSLKPMFKKFNFNIHL